MARLNNPQPWSSNPSDAYLPLLHEGRAIGFCKPAYLKQIVDLLNEEDRMRKALYLACRDLLNRSGDETATVNDLVQHYLTQAERPKRGTGAIALLLKERQEELDLTNEEFARFCDTFRLSPEQLRGIYAGVDLEHSQINPIARILGISVDEIIEIWRGKE